MGDELQFFIFDDDEAILAALKGYIQKMFPIADIYSAADGGEALELIRDCKKPAIFISDLFMPNVNGVQLLIQVKTNEAIKDSYFIVTGNAQDKDEAIIALKKGCDGIISKPLKVEELIDRLRSATKFMEKDRKILGQQEEIKKLNDEIESNAQRLLSLFRDFQYSRIPESKQIIEKISKATNWITKKIDRLNPIETENIKQATELSFVGRLYLPDKNILEPVMKKGILSNPLMEKVPESAFELISQIRGYEKVAEILYHVYENWDGSGISKQLQAQQIPLGSRIIRVAIDFEDLFKSTNGNYEKSMEQLYHENKRLYDFRIVTYYDQYLAEHGMSNYARKEKSISLAELKEGLTISRGITVNSGLMILGGGTNLKDEHIDKIRDIAKKDPIIGKVYIQFR